jgi:hypothetical protein
VVDVLRHDPELLAIADAVAATQPLNPGEVPNATPTRQGLGAETSVRWRGDLGSIAEQ